LRRGRDGGIRKGLRALGLIALGLVVVGMTAWATLAIPYSNLPGEPLRIGLATALVLLCYHWLNKGAHSHP
jgi:hypothetical protein